MKRSCFFILSLLLVLGVRADGFHIISWHEPYYEGLSKKNLDNYGANQYGVKQSFYETLSKAGSKQWLATLAKHPALYGYFITDEPFMYTYSVVKSSLNSNKNFDWVKERVSLYNRCDNTHVVYVNLVSSEATHIAYNKSSPMLLINKMQQYENM